MKSAPAMAAFSAPCFAPLSAVRSDLSARFILARLIGRVGELACSAFARSTDFAHAAAPAQLFHAAQETAVRHHIIAFRLHHHHEISFPLHVKQYLRLSLALTAKRVQGIDRAFGRVAEGNPYAQRLRPRYRSFVERNDVVCRNLDRTSVV